MRRSSSNPRLRALCVGWLSLTLAYSSTARADDSEEAIKRGVALRRARQDAEALEQFRLALALRSSPRALAQAGLAEQALGRWVEAERDLEQALQVDGDAWIVEHREILNEALLRIREQLGTLELSADQPGAEVWVAGARAGVLPHELRAPAGTLELELRAPGQKPVRRSIAVVAQQTVREQVSFESTSATPTTLESKVHAPVSAPAPARPPARRAAPQTEAAPGMWPWVTLGGALAFVAGGVTAHVVRERASARYNDDERCFFGDQTRGERCGGDLSRARTSGTLAIVGYSAGAVLGGVSAYLWLRKPGSDDSARVGVVTQQDHALLTYQTPFGRSW